MKNKKVIWIGGIVGGLYALIPLLIQFIFKPSEAYQWLLLIPFMLSAWSFLISVSIVILLFENSQLSSNITIIMVVVNCLNIILWVLIGMLVGYITSKIMKRGRKRI